MNDLRYYGTYARFDTLSKKDAAPLLGADNLVGDLFTIDFENEDGRLVAWLVNRFGARIGYLDESVSRNLNICRARSWTSRAYLSFVAFTDTPEPGIYWGQVALICSDPHYDEAVDAFAQRVSALLCDGIRPDVDLSDSGIAAVLRNDGTWMTENRAPYPTKKHGTAILKKTRKLSEKMIEQGRQGNIGCYVVSIAFIVIVLALIAFGLHMIGLF